MPVLDSSAASDLTKRRFLPLLLVLIAMLGPFTLTAMVPALPAIADEFAVSTAMSQIVLSLSLFATAIASLVYGKVADVFGRLPGLLAGITLAVVGSTMAALAPTVAWVVAGRVLQAVGAGAGYVLVRVIVSDVYGNHRAAAVIGYVTAAMALAPMLAPVFGGLLVDWASWRWMFGSVAIMSLTLLALVWQRLPETRPAHNTQGPATPAAPHATATSWLSLFTRPEYLRFLIVGVSAQAAFFAYLSGAPYLMIQQYGMNASTYGAFHALVPGGFLVGSLIAGRKGTRWGNTRLCFVGVNATFAGAAVALAWMAWSPFNPWALFVPMFGSAVGAGMSMAGAQAGMIHAAPDQPGVASASFTFIMLTNSALTAQLVASLLYLGRLTVPVALAVTSLIGLIGYAYWTRCSAAQSVAGSANQPHNRESSGATPHV